MIDLWPVARGGENAETLLLAIALTRLPDSIRFPDRAACRGQQKSAPAILSDASRFIGTTMRFEASIAEVVAQRLQDARPSRKKFEAKFE